MVAYLKDDSGFFQQICPHAGADDVELLVEVDLDVLAEPRRVVVPRGFRVAYGLHDRRGRQHSFLYLENMLCHHHTARS